MLISPMANGLPTGAYNKSSSFDTKADYRNSMPQFREEAYEQNRKLLELIYDVAGKNKATPAQISMAWMLCKKPYIVPIPGSRKSGRIKENAGAAEIKLSMEEVQAIDSALEKMEMSAVFGGSALLKRGNG